MPTPDAEIRPWTVERTEDIQDCRIFTLQRLSETSPAGKHGEFYILDSPDWVNVIPITNDGHIVCVEQYRHGSRRVALETPAGMVEAGEAPEVAAARELREETGYSAKSLQILGRVYGNPAFMTNHLTILLAEGVTLTDPTEWDDHEEIRVRLIAVGDIPGILARGEIENSVSALALTWYLLHSHGLLPAQG